MGGDNFYEQVRKFNRNRMFEAGAKWADANPKSPWISVKDDLPCNHEELLDKNLEGYTKAVLAIYGNLIHPELSRSVDIYFMHKHDDNKYHWCVSGIEEVLYWMPIPELPKE